MTEEIVEVAAFKLGYGHLKDEQRELILDFVRDVFGVLPTGFGKSLCYQCLPYVFDAMRDDGLQL